MGEVEGVSSKGVEALVLSIKSKFERLDGGLMSVSDNAPAILDEIGMVLLIGSRANGVFFMKHPNLSLKSLLFFVVASVANTYFCLRSPMSKSPYILVVLILKVLFLFLEALFVVWCSIHSHHQMDRSQSP